ncbi:MAG: hypothetical protein KatS3mg105_1967 [Gemmatales bacterium]|nr:MAG: hypothetical protein KatS3mg105_1967 [Gemmatales bacterium]
MTVEFFGIPRQRAGQEQYVVDARSLFEAVHAVETRFPGLAGFLIRDGRLSPYVLASLNGERFISDSATELRPGDHLLLLSADAGG